MNKKKSMLALLRQVVHKNVNSKISEDKYVVDEIYHFTTSFINNIKELETCTVVKCDELCHWHILLFTVPKALRGR